LEKRRIEILNLFENEVYGKTPAGKVHLSAILLSENKAACNGLAIRKEVLIRLNKDGQDLELTLLLYLPKSNKKKSNISWL